MRNVLLREVSSGKKKDARTVTREVVARTVDWGRRNGFLLLLVFDTMETK